jgi:hypothetical protein
VITKRAALGTLLWAAFTAGCASAPIATAPAASSPEPTSGATGIARPAPSTPAPDQTARTLRDVVGPLDAGTYRWVSPRAGVVFPAIHFTVPAGWSIDGRFIFRGQVVPTIPVAMQFWDVGQVYGHPCQWRGTLFDPGPSVADLTSALVDVPLRNATDPVDVTIDGYQGTYLEWSVPDDIDFADCDADEGDGTHYFESWSGDQSGWGGDRYHQGPGQVDRIWILDVDGVRFVIDAFSMPDATPAEIAELLAVVSSLTFER